jgi:hypothetical protein
MQFVPAIPAAGRGSAAFELSIPKKHEKWERSEVESSAQFPEESETWLGEAGME